MSDAYPTDHFKGKSVVEHLKEARTKGVEASHETHGIEMPGHVAACADASKETAVILSLFWILLFSFSLPEKKILILFSFFGIGLAIWKAGRSALLGWARMERLHRLVEEERWEITHHRAQERSELAEMYRAKGFEGPLLENVLDVLMSDDNRLLKVMLEEELGLTLETYEHPLKQSLGAFLGVLATCLLCMLGLQMHTYWGLPIAVMVCMGVATYSAAKIEKNRLSTAILWNLALCVLVISAVYFVSQLKS